MVDMTSFYLGVIMMFLLETIFHAKSGQDPMLLSRILFAKFFCLKNTKWITYTIIAGILILVKYNII